jgi:proteasome alpha subunit
MDREDAIVLGLKALKKATEEEKLNSKGVEIGVVMVGENFRKLDEGEVEKLVDKPNAA